MKFMIDQIKIGKFIAKVRKEKGLTQEGLAEILNVSNRTISKWENGYSIPDYYVLEGLCKALDLEISELLYGRRGDCKAIKNRNELVFKYVLYGLFIFIIFFVLILLYK